MKKRNSSDVISSLQDYCSRNRIPITPLGQTAFVIEKYDGKARPIWLHLEYFSDTGCLVARAKGGPAIDQAEVGDILLYTNAASSVALDEKLYVCPHCGELTMLAMINHPKVQMSDLEIQELLVKIAGAYESHASIIERIISGKSMVEDTIQEAMKGRYLI